MITGDLASVLHNSWDKGLRRYLASDFWSRTIQSVIRSPSSSEEFQVVKEVKKTKLRKQKNIKNYEVRTLLLNKRHHNMCVDKAQSVYYNRGRNCSEFTLNFHLIFAEIESSIVIQVRSRKELPKLCVLSIIRMRLPSYISLR